MAPSQAKTDPVLSLSHSLDHGFVHYRTWHIDGGMLKDSPQNQQRSNVSTSASSSKSATQLERDDVLFWNQLHHIENMLTMQDAAFSDTSISVWTWWREEPREHESIANPALSRTDLSPPPPRMTLWAFALDEITSNKLYALTLPPIAIPGSHGQISFDRIYPTRNMGLAWEPSPSCDEIYYQFCVAMKQSLVRHLRSTMTSAGYDAVPWNEGKTLLVNSGPLAVAHQGSRQCLILQVHVQIENEGLLVDISVATTSLYALREMSHEKRLRLRGKEIILAPMGMRAKMSREQLDYRDDEFGIMIDVTLQRSPTTFRQEGEGHDVTRILKWPLSHCFVRHKEWSETILPGNPINHFRKMSCSQKSDMPYIVLRDLDQQMKQSKSLVTKASDVLNALRAGEGDDMKDYDAAGMTEDDFSFFDCAPSVHLGLSMPDERHDKVQPTTTGFLHGPAGLTPGKTPNAQDILPLHMDSPRLDHTGATPFMLASNATGGLSEGQPLLGSSHTQPTPRSMLADTPRSSDLDFAVHTVLQVQENNSVEMARSQIADQYNAIPFDSEWINRESKYRSIGALDQEQEETCAPCRSQSPEGAVKKRRVFSVSKTKSRKRTSIYRAPLTPMSNCDQSSSSDESTTSSDLVLAGDTMRSEKVYAIELCRAIIKGWQVDFYRPILYCDDLVIRGQDLQCYDKVLKEVLSCLQSTVSVIELRARPRQPCTSLESPTVIVKRRSDTLQLDLTAIQNWIHLELAPLGGSRNVAGLVLWDDSADALQEDDINDWLDDFASYYSAMNLGKCVSLHRTIDFRPLKLNSSLEDKSSLQVLQRISARLALANIVGSQPEIVYFYISASRQLALSARERLASKNALVCNAFVPINANALLLPWTDREHQNLALEIYSNFKKPIDSRAPFLLESPSRAPIRFCTDNWARCWSVLYRSYTLFVNYRIGSDGVLEVRWTNERGEFRDVLTIQIYAEDNGIRSYEWMREVVQRTHEICSALDLDWQIVLAKIGQMGRMELQSWRTNFLENGMTDANYSLSIVCISGTVSSTRTISYGFAHNTSTMEFSIDTHPTLLQDTDYETTPQKPLRLKPHVDLVALATALVTTRVPGTEEKRSMYLLAFGGSVLDPSRKKSPKEDAEMTLDAAKTLSEICKKFAYLEIADLLLQRPTMSGTGMYN